MATTTHDRPHSEHAPHVEATEARQGEWGRDVLWVLVIASLLAAIALFGTWATRAPDLAAAQAETQASAPDTDVSLAPVRNEAVAAPVEQAPPEG